MELLLRDINARKGEIIDPKVFSKILIIFLFFGSIIYKLLDLFIWLITLNRFGWQLRDFNSRR